MLLQISKQTFPERRRARGKRLTSKLLEVLLQVGPREHEDTFRHRILVGQTFVAGVHDGRAVQQRHVPLPEEATGG